MDCLGELNRSEAALLIIEPNNQDQTPLQLARALVCSQTLAERLLAVVESQRHPQEADAALVSFCFSLGES